MDEELKKALQEYVATVNSGKYQSWEEIDSKFPELGVYSAEVLKEYVATANSGKYQSWDEINSKFPELGKAQEVPAQGSADTSVTSGTQQSDSAEPLSAEPDIVISQQDIDNLSINDISPPEGISAGSVYIPYDTSKPVTDTETGEELPEGIRSAATALLESNPNRKVVGVLRDGQGVIYTEPDSPDVQRVYLAPVEGPFTNEGAMDPYVEASLITDGEWYQNDRGVWVYRMQEYPDDLSYDFINYFEKNIPDVAVEDPSGRTIYYGAGNGPTSDETAAQISYFQDPDTSRRLAGLIQGYRESNPNEYVPIRTISEINKAQGMIFQTPEQTTLSRAGKVVGDVAELSYNNLLLGVGGVLSGVIDLGLQAAALVKVPGEDWGSILTEYRTEGADNVRNVLVDVIGTDVNQYTADRYKNNIIAGGITSLAYSAPAFVGSKLRMGRIFLQSFDAAMGSIQEADQEGQLSNFSKSIYGLMVGSAVAGLEKLGFDAAFGGAVKRMGVAIANKTLRDVAQSGAKVTAATLERRLKDNLNQTSVRFLQGGANSLVGSLGEFFTEGAQGVFEGGSRYALNFLTGKDIFDTSDETWGSFAQDVLTQSAMGAVGGSIMGGVGSIIGAGRRQKVTQLSRQVYDIDTELRRGNLDQPTKEQLLKIKLESLSELSSIASDNNNEYLKLSAEQQIHLEELNKEAFELETIIADPEVSETVKAASNERLNRIDAEIGEIDKWTPQTETTEVSGTPQQEVAETLADASTPQSEVEATPVVKTEAEAQAGEYFTRDIGGEQTVYRRNEDGTASIVPDAEAQQVLAQQAETSPVSEQATQARVEEEGQPTSTQEAGGTSLQGPQQGGLSQNNAPATQDFFTAVVEGTDPRFIPIKPYETEGTYSPEQAKVAEAMEPKFGNFDTHIATSIPQYRETQVKKAAGIIAVLEGREDAKVFDIGGSEGNMVKTITELTGVETYNLEPNEAMASSHEATPVEGSTVIREAFYEGFDGHEAHVPTEKYDVVNESMVFQFITPERKQFIDHVADNYLKEDGLFISEEKLKTNRDLYIENEAQKDREHKSKYYTPDQLKLKSDQVLMGMDENQADVREYVEALKGRFKHVGLYWNSGNFYGIAASNSKNTFDKFMQSVGDTTTPYTKVGLGEVTDVSTIPSSQDTQQTESTTQEAQSSEQITQELTTPTFFETLSDSDARGSRISELRQRLADNLREDQNLGIAPNNRRRAQREIDFVRDLTELAILSIADGTIKTAEAFRQMARGIGDFGDNVLNRAYTAATESVDEYKRWARPKEATDARIGEVLARMQDVTIDRRPAKTKIKPKTVKDLTHGGITGKVDLTNRAALKAQIQTLNRGIREGRGQIKAMQKQVLDFLKESQKAGVFKGSANARSVTALINKVSNIGSKDGLLDALQYAEKLADTVDYSRKRREAQTNQKRMRTMSKRKGVPANIKGLLADMARVELPHVDNIEHFNSLATEFMKTVEGASTQVSAETIKSFTDRISRIADKAKVERMQGRLIEAGMDAETVLGLTTVKQLESAIDSLPENTDKQKETVDDIRRKSYEAGREQLGQIDTSTLSPLELEALDTLKKLDVSGMEREKLALAARAMSNAITNGRFDGVGELMGELQVQELASDKSFIERAKEHLRTPSEMGDKLRKFAGTVTSRMLSTVRNPKYINTAHKLVNYAGIKKSAAQAVRRFESDILKPAEQLFKRHRDDLSDPKQQVLLGMYQDLAQYRASWTQEEIQEEFEARKRAIEETILALEADPDTNPWSGRKEANYAKNLRDVFEEVVRDASSADDIKKHFNTGIRAFNRLQRNFWDNMFQEMLDNARIINNIDMDTDWVNFSPRSYKSMDPMADSQQAQWESIMANNGSVTFGTFDIKADMSGSQKNRTITGAQLPKDRGKVTKAIDLRAVDTFYEMARKAVYDVETQKDRLISNTMGRSKRIGNLVGSKPVMGIINDAVLQKVRADSYLLMPVREKTAVRSFVNGLQQWSARQALGGFLQIVKQSVPVLTDAAIRLGERSYLLPLGLQMYYQNKEAIDEMIDARPVGRRAIRDIIKPESTLSDSQKRASMRQLQGQLSRLGQVVDNGIDKLTMEMLQTGDAASAKAIWLAFYMDHLKSSGVKVADFSEGFVNVNEDAAEYADTMTDTIANISDPSLRPTLFAGTSGTIVNLLSPFASFSMNNKIDFLSNVARLREARSAADVARIAKHAAGNLSALVTYGVVGSGIRSAAIKATAWSILQLIAKAGDWDDEEKELARAFIEDWENEKLVSNKLNSRKYIISDVMYGGIAQDLIEPWADKPVTDLVNYLWGTEEGEATYQGSGHGDPFERWGRYGIPFSRLQTLYKNFANYAETDESYRMRKFSMEDAFGDNRRVPLDLEDTGRPDVSRDAMGIALIANIAATFSLYNQEVAAIVRRYPGLIRDLENYMHGHDKEDKLVEIEKLREFTYEDVKISLTDEQFEWAKKKRRELAEDLYPAYKIQEVVVGDEASELEARREITTLAQKLTVLHFELTKDVGKATIKKTEEGMRKGRIATEKRRQRESGDPNKPSNK